MFPEQHPCQSNVCVYVCIKEQTIEEGSSSACSLYDKFLLTGMFGYYNI